MAWFGFRRAAADTILLQGDGVYLRPPIMDDHPAWASLRAGSQTFLVPFEPTWPDDELTAGSFRRRVRRCRDEAERDQAWHFLIFRRGDDQLLGGLTLGEIQRGVSQTGTLGYWMGAPHAGKGHMTRAVRAVAIWGFGQLRLHRIEAACVVANAASARLLEKNGFQREGRARAYLKINGVWQDHELFALLATDAQPHLALASGHNAPLPRT